MGRSDAFFQDLWFAGRLIRRNPAFAMLVIALLALGFGSAAAVFSLLDSALLRPLPYRDPARLALLTRSDDEQTGTGFSLNLLDRIRRSAPALESLAGFQYESFSVVFDSEPERLPGMLVTANLFATLGVEPASGAGFQAHSVHEVIVSDALAQRRPGMLGRTLRLNGTIYTVAGVMPPWFHFDRGEGLASGFDFSRSVDVWAPVPPSAAERGNFLIAIARIRPSLSLRQAQAALNVTAHNLRSPRGLKLSLAGLSDEVTRPLRAPVLLLFSGVTLLLSGRVCQCRESAALSGFRPQQRVFHSRLPRCGGLAADASTHHEVLPLCSDKRSSPTLFSAWIRPV